MQRNTLIALVALFILPCLGFTCSRDEEAHARLDAIEPTVKQTAENVTALNQRMAETKEAMDRAFSSSGYKDESQDDESEAAGPGSTKAEEGIQSPNDAEAEKEYDEKTPPKHWKAVAKYADQYERRLAVTEEGLSELRRIQSDDRLAVNQRLGEVEAKNVEQDARLDKIEERYSGIERQLTMIAAGGSLSKLADFLGRLCQSQVSLPVGRRLTDAECLAIISGLESKVKSFCPELAEKYRQDAQQLREELRKVRCTQAETHKYLVKNHRWAVDIDRKVNPHRYCKPVHYGSTVPCRKVLLCD